MTNHLEPKARNLRKSPLPLVAVGCGLSVAAIAAAPTIFSRSAAISADSRYLTQSSSAFVEFTSEDPVPPGLAIIVR